MAKIANTENLKSNDTLKTKKDLKNRLIQNPKKKTGIKISTKQPLNMQMPWKG
jgi:hypothetical protein